MSLIHFQIFITIEKTVKTSLININVLQMFYECNTIQVFLVVVILLIYTTMDTNYCNNRDRGTQIMQRTRKILLCLVYEINREVRGFSRIDGLHFHFHVAKQLTGAPLTRMLLILAQLYCLPHDFVLLLSQPWFIKILN